MALSMCIKYQTLILPSSKLSALDARWEIKLNFDLLFVFICIRRDMGFSRKFCLFSSIKNKDFIEETNRKPRKDTLPFMITRDCKSGWGRKFFETIKGSIVKGSVNLWQLSW